MSPRFRRWPAILGSAFSSAALTLSITGAEPPLPALLPDAVAQAPKEQPKAPVPAAAPEQPAVPPSTQAAPSAPSVSPTLISDILGGAGVGSSGAGAVNPASTTQGALSASQQAATGGSTNTVGGGEAAVRATSDVGDLLGKSLNALGVWIERRSPIITNPNIRGYHVGQYVTVADGGYWFPARMDLDTIVSKIDSSQIENILVIKGPYSVRYGPGFAFIDVETLATPRYQDGQQYHGQTGIVYKSNGQQWAGLQSAWGGDETSGFRMSYLIGTGASYWDGNGVRQPSGYNTQTFNLDYGFNIGRYSKVEIKATHLEQHDVKIPGAPVDIGYLSSDAYTARFAYNDPNVGKIGVDGWFNYTNLYGNNFLPSKQQQFPFLDFFGGRFITTDADLASAGTRAYVTLGQSDGIQATVGFDFRYLDSQLTEYLFNFPGTPGAANQAFPIPRSYTQDPGLFADLRLPVLEDRLLLKAGVRFDWVTTAISNLGPFAPPPPVFSTADPTAVDRTGPNPRSYFTNAALTGEQLARQFSLWSIFFNPEYKWTDNLTLTAGVGYAQRPPTATELYAIAPFMGVLQKGYNAVRGNPLLPPETLYQADLGFRYAGERARLGANGYFASIKNYITYEPTRPFLGNGFDGVSYQFTNTRRAILAGCEAYAEWDARRWLTVFSTMQYVRGQDLNQDNRGAIPIDNQVLTPTGQGATPLPNIPPLEARAGLRFHDPNANPRWGAELTSRMMAAQNQVAVYLNEVPTGGFTVFDLRTYYRPNSNVLLTAGIENIFDKQYQLWNDYRLVTNQGVFQPGFSAYVGMRLTY